MAPGVVTVRGPRAAEARLERRLEALAPRSPHDLARPVRVVVPSQGLRLHLAARLVRGGAVAGVVVQTLYGLALEVLERAGERSSPGESTYEVLVRRRAGREPVLRQALDHLEDGYGGVAASVRDLLDAGLEPAHADAAVDQLRALAGGAVARPVAARAEALVRVAAVAAAEAEALGASRTSTLLRRAAELIADRPDEVLPARAVLVSGFADATAVAADLVEALVRHRGAEVLLDRPLDPVDGSEAAGEYGAPFARRLDGLAQAAGEEAAPDPAPLRCVAAADVDAEARAALEWASDLLARGAVAERVGIVARDPGRFATPLRRHADRLGVPLSGLGARVPAGAARGRCLALAEVLRQGGRTPVDVWLQAVSPASTPVEALGLAMRCLGAGRLEEAASLKPRTFPSAGVVLPVLAGWDEGEEGESRSRRRLLPRPELERWVRRARAATRTARGWRRLAAVEVHLEASLALAGAIGAGDDAGQVAAGALRAAAADLPPGFPLDRDEWLLLAARALEVAGTEPLGGLGGGVQVLGAMEARGRTFLHLWLLGLNRDLFPRTVREDPLLPDEVRERLRDVLPELPVKRHGWDEERYLLAELAAAAEVEVTASWHGSERGALLAPSPFVDRLDPSRELRSAAPPAAAPGGAQPAIERAVAAGLAGDRDAWQATLAVAVGEGRSRAGVASSRVPPAELAAARRELVDELDPERPRPGLGPFSGLVGRVSGGVDPRRRDPAVTTLEAVARCPWQAFLSRVLRLALPPDPLFALPSAPASLVGTVVHRVLEQVVRSAVGRPESLDEALGRSPARAPWPERRALEEMVTSAARDAAQQVGLESSGVVPMLEVLVLPLLESAREADWSAGEGPPAIAVELTTVVAAARGGRRLTLRADRVDRDGDRLSLTDYKTGRGIRQAALAGEVGRGTMLQGVAYALVAGGAGRYLYLDPDPKRAPAREVVALASDAELVGAFERSVEVLSAAHEEGSFPPRVAKAGSDRRGDWCTTCDVAQACLLEDSSYRRRLVEWQREEPGGTAAERAAWDVWWLGAETTRGRGMGDEEDGG